MVDDALAQVLTQRATAPIAVFCGVMAIRDIRANTFKRGKGRAIFGIIAGSLIMALFATGFLVNLRTVRRG